MLGGGRVSGLAPGACCSSRALIVPVYGGAGTDSCMSRTRGIGKTGIKEAKEDKNLCGYKPDTPVHGW